MNIKHLTVCRGSLWTYLAMDAIDKVACAYKEPIDSNLLATSSMSAFLCKQLSQCDGEKVSWIILFSPQHV